MKSMYVSSMVKFYHADKKQILDIYKIDWEHHLVHCQDNNGTYTHGMYGNKILKATEITDYDTQDLFEDDIIGVADAEGNIVIGYLCYECGLWIIVCDPKYDEDGYVLLSDYFFPDCDSDVEWINGCRKLGNIKIDKTDQQFNDVTIEQLHYEDDE